MERAQLQFTVCLEMSTVNALVSGQTGALGVKQVFVPYCSFWEFPSWGLEHSLLCYEYLITV
jgi:hypothetical protein